MTSSKLTSLVQLIPLNPAYRADPHAILGPLREGQPVFRDPASGNILLARYADVRSTVNDLAMWRDPMRAKAGAKTHRLLTEIVDQSRSRASTTSILLLDDPDHGRIRAPLSQALYARVAQLRRTIEAVVDDALDRIAGSDRFDLMGSFAVPVPIDVIANVLGVDHARLEEFRAWTEGIIQSLNPIRSQAQTELMQASELALGAYLTDAFAERRARPRDDLISDMVQRQADGADLSDDELRINITALLVGGNLTTTDLIGNGVRLLLLHPAEREKLRQDPGNIKRAVEEVLRFESPVDVTGRIVSGDREIGGCPMTRGQSLMLSLRAANRDPDVFECPDRFDISRPHRPHVAFGGGAHICIGAPLARLEAQIAIGRLFDRFPDLRLTDPEARPVWRTLPFFRGLQTLSVSP